MNRCCNNLVQGNTTLATETIFFDLRKNVLMVELHKSYSFLLVGRSNIYHQSIGYGLTESAFVRQLQKMIKTHLSDTDIQGTIAHMELQKYSKYHIHHSMSL